MSMELSIALLFSIIGFTFVYLSVNLDKRHGILGWFFLPLAIVMFIVPMFSLSELGTNEGLNNILNGSGFVLIITLLLLIGYFFIFLLAHLFGKLSPSEKSPYDDKLKV